MPIPEIDTSVTDITLVVPQQLNVKQPNNSKPVA